MNHAPEPGFDLERIEVLRGPSATSTPAVNRVIFSTPAALENVGGQFTTPRTYGIRVRAHFGS